MKEIDIFDTVRRGTFLGSTPNREMGANSKNRFSILAVVTLKTGNVISVEYTIIEDKKNSYIFLQFVRRLLEKNTLERGDVFVVDNCSIHLHGDNIGIQEDFLSRMTF